MQSELMLLSTALGESPRSMSKLLTGAAGRAVINKRGTLKPEDVRGENE